MRGRRQLHGDGSPGRTGPPRSTTPMTPALRTNVARRASRRPPPSAARPEAVDLQARVAQAGDDHGRPRIVGSPPVGGRRSRASKRRSPRSERRRHRRRRIERSPPAAAAKTPATARQPARTASARRSPSLPGPAAARRPPRRPALAAARRVSGRRCADPRAAWPKRRTVPARQPEQIQPAGRHVLAQLARRDRMPIGRTSAEQLAPGSDAPAAGWAASGRPAPGCGALTVTPACTIRPPPPSGPAARSNDLVTRSCRLAEPSPNDPVTAGPVRPAPRTPAQRLHPAPVTLRPGRMSARRTAHARGRLSRP